MQYKPNMKIYDISMMTTSAFSTGKQILDHVLQGSRCVLYIYDKKSMPHSILCLRIFSLFKELFNYVEIIKTSMFWAC